MRVKDQTLRVIGVLATKGGGGIGSVDDQAFAPITFVHSSACSARARPTATATGWPASCSRPRTPATSRPSRIASRVLLRERHHLKADGSADDFHDRPTRRRS